MCESYSNYRGFGYGIIWGLSTANIEWKTGYFPWKNIGMISEKGEAIKRNEGNLESGRG